MPESTTLPLGYLRAGDWAEIDEITGESAWVGRLAELGIRAGSRLCVVRQGSPCLLQIDGSRFSLRGEAGAQILVRPLDARLDCESTS